MAAGLYPVFFCTFASMAQHNELGRMGEEAAARYLMFHDYSIRDLNWHCGHWELDIVAERYGELVVVEVKSRSSERYGTPVEAVDEEKKRHLSRAADVYMRYYKLDMPVRFDIIAVTGVPPACRIEHIRNAFRPLLWDEHLQKP